MRAAIKAKKVQVAEWLNQPQARDRFYLRRQAQFGNCLARARMNRKDDRKAPRNLCEGFEHYEHHNLAMARRSLLNAARLDPGCLKNRGVLSVLLQSVVGQTPMRAMRRLRRSGLSGQRTG